MLAILFAVFFPSPVSPDFSVLSPNKDTEQETLEGMRRGFGVQLALEQQDFNPMGPLTHKCFFNKHSRACLSTVSPSPIQPTQIERVFSHSQRQIPNLKFFTVIENIAFHGVG